MASAIIAVPKIIEPAPVLNLVGRCLAGTVELMVIWPKIVKHLLPADDAMRRAIQAAIALNAMTSYADDANSLATWLEIALSPQY